MKVLSGNHSVLSGRRKMHYRFTVASFISVFLLILIGATVRITGSGMGCPDWPKCFGQYVPPTVISDIPQEYTIDAEGKTTYQEEYSRRGYAPGDFPMMTWIEYVNRLWSAVIVGPLLLISFILSFSWWRTDKSFVFMGAVILLLTGFEAWLGKRLIDYHLENVQITLHLIPAMMILMLCAFSMIRARSYTIAFTPPMPSRPLSTAIYIMLGVLLMQIVLGTFVRTELDLIAQRMGLGERPNWMSQANEYFPVHRSFSWLVAGLAVFLAIRLRKEAAGRKLYTACSFAMMNSLVGQIGSGILLAYGGFPEAGQLLHMSFSMAMFSVISLLIAYHLVSARRAREVNKVFLV